MRDSGGFARICDMEPGMHFRLRTNRQVLTFKGIDPVKSQFAHKEHVQVLTEEGPSWITDKWERFPLLTTEAR